MDEILKNIILISAMGSVLALILLCIKPLTKRLFSPKWQYYIWLTVLIVMVLPIKVSLQNEPAHITPAENTQVQTEQITPVEADQEQKQPVALSDLSQSPALRTPDIPINIMRFSSFLWLVVAVLLLGCKLVKYTVFLREIKKYSVIECGFENLPKRLTVRKTEFLDAPLIVGLIKPVLYLPQAEIKENELDYILLHELTHYRRHDLLYKWFSMLVSSIHWFNPFVYIVSKQIDEECEVSCDYEVCKNLSEMQKKDYMVMILDFVQTSIRKKRPLTTQMASSKKILKRRFTVMKTKKVTSKFVSVLSVILALAMLSTTVFASGVLSGLTEDNYTIDLIGIDGNIIELEDKPIIYNGIVYVPMREILEKNTNLSYIEWNNGLITVAILEDKGDSGFYRMTIGNPHMEVQHFQKSEFDTFVDEYENNPQLIKMSLEMDGEPILITSKTYIPLVNINYMLYGFLNKRDTNNNLSEIGYSIYDKQGDNITEQFNTEKETGEEFELMKSPVTTTGLFFNAFSDRDFEKMKNYCTSSCINDFFGDDYVFGMKQANVVDIQISVLEYAKSSNDFNIFVTVNMTPHEGSVFDPSQTSTSFYVCLLRQPDGRYLIDEFATGL